MAAMQETTIMAGLTSVLMETPNPSKPTLREIAESPWAYRGYKDFTSYVAADPDFFALVELEEKLDAMDELFSLKTTKIVGCNPPVVVNINSIAKGKATDAGVDREVLDARDINNGTIRDDMPERAELVAKITAKLAEYDQLLLNHCSLRNMRVAPTRNVENIRRWLASNRGAIMEDETLFINHHDDLVSGSVEKSALRGFFEDQVVLRTKTFLGLFRTPPPPSLSPRDRDDTYHFSDQAVDTFASIAVFITALVMLIAPLWILQAVENNRTKLAVITFFVVICLLFLSFATLGRPFERLAATAGYSAVLVVFLQLGQ
ncbi:hypothetical protein M426DRAFT_17752 [Hypoxylon sp. CI-4A]|nr:hypothetical protein M426DRAFT_17752 [Hypoxylon sp. CI-4A]